MTSTPEQPVPAGWYADPAAPPHAPAQRYWDGARWTEHLAPAAVSAFGPPSTPDGVPLAGWGRRLGAYVIDSLLLGIVNLLVGIPFLRSIIPVYVDYFNESMDAAAAGRQGPSILQIYREAFWPLLGWAILGFVLLVTYQAVMLRWRGATVGKLAVGLRVRLRDAPGQLPWSAIARRIAAQYWVSLVAWIPYVGGVLALYGWVDGLWPLWDGNRQSLHDKFARTNVVKPD